MTAWPSGWRFMHFWVLFFFIRHTILDFYHLLNLYQKKEKRKEGGRDKNNYWNQRKILKTFRKTWMTDMSGGTVKRKGLTVWSPVFVILTDSFLQPESEKTGLEKNRHVEKSRSTERTRQGQWYTTSTHVNMHVYVLFGFLIKMGFIS